MLKMKQQKKQALKMITNAVNEGMKVAEDKIVDIRAFVQPGIQGMQGRVTSHPIMAALTILGIGLTIIGSTRILKK